MHGYTSAANATFILFYFIFLDTRKHLAVKNRCKVWVPIVQIAFMALHNMTGNYRQELKAYLEIIKKHSTPEAS